MQLLPFGCACNILKAVDSRYDLCMLSVVLRVSVNFHRAWCFLCLFVLFVGVCVILEGGLREGTTGTVFCVSDGLWGGLIK